VSFIRRSRPGEAIPESTPYAPNVFWPKAGEPFDELTGAGFPVSSSDHRLVRVDVILPG